MLDNEARRDLMLIKQIADQVWGANCRFGDLKVMDSPYPEFEIPLRLYEKWDIGIYYDRSAVDIGIKQGEKYVLLDKFTTQKVFRGMNAMTEDNLLHNFELLNEVVLACS